jgi:hypothetical protein
MRVKYDDELSFEASDIINHQWGYTVVVKVYDSTGDDGGFCLVWPKGVAPNQTDVVRRTLGRMVTFREDKDNYVEPLPVEYKVRYADIVELLVERGYLEEGRRLEDLPDLTLQEPRVAVWRRVWEFLTRPLWG